jgi:hypothetical protein
MSEVKYFDYNITGEWSGTWSATTDSTTWLRAELITDQRKLAVTADTNPAYTSRSGNVQVKYNNDTCKSIPVTQAGKTCDCDAFTFTRATSIPQTGLTAGTTLLTFTSEGSCTGFSAKIRKNSEPSTDLNVGNNAISLVSAILLNDTQDSITYTVEIIFGGEPCDIYEFIQPAAAIICNCSSLGTLTTITSIPQGGLSSGSSAVTWSETTDCEDISGTLSGSNGTTQNLIADTVNKALRLSNAISSNTTSDDITYIINVKYDTEDCITTAVTQPAVTIECGCGAHQYVEDNVDNVIPFTGRTGEILVFQGYLFNDVMGVPVSALSEDCFDMIKVEKKYSVGITNFYYEKVINNIPVTQIPGFAPGGTATCIKLYLRDVPQNQTRTVAYENIVIGYSDNEGWCMGGKVIQEGYVQCSCSSILEMVYQYPNAKYFSSAATSNVIFASGDTHGCGQIHATIGTSSQLITNFTETPIPGPTSGENQYIWSGNITQMPQEQTSRSLAINFTFTDLFGTPHECSDKIYIQQNLDFCDCQQFPSEGVTKTINAPARKGRSFDLLNITGVTPTFKRYDKICTFVALVLKDGEDASWIANGDRMTVAYNGNTHTFTADAYALDSNDTCRTRSCVYEVYSISNISSNGIAYNTTRKEAYHAYNKEEDILCYKLGEITISQESLTCDCNEVELEIDSSYISNTNLMPGGTATIFYELTCGYVSDIKCVTSEYQSDEQVNFVEVTYFSYGTIRLSATTNDLSSEDRGYQLKFTIKSNCDDSVVCERWVDMGIVYGCNCDNASTVYYPYYYGSKDIEGTTAILRIPMDNIYCDNFVGWGVTSDALIPMGETCENQNYWIKTIDTSIEETSEGKYFIVAIEACVNTDSNSRSTDFHFYPIIIEEGVTITCQTESTYITLTQSGGQVPCSSCSEKVGYIYTESQYFEYDEYDGITSSRILFRLNTGDTECCTGIYYAFEYKINGNIYEITSIPGRYGDFNLSSASTNNYLEIYAVPFRRNEWGSYNGMYVYANAYDGNGKLNCQYGAACTQGPNPNYCPGTCDSTMASTIQRNISYPYGGESASNPINITEGPDCSTPGNSLDVIKVPKTILGNCYNVLVTSEFRDSCNDSSVPMCILTKSEDSDYVIWSAAFKKSVSQSNPTYAVTADIHIQYKDNNNTWQNCGGTSDFILYFSVNQSH